MNNKYWIGALVIIFLFLGWLFWSSSYAVSLGLRPPKNYIECSKIGGQVKYPFCVYKGERFYGGPQ